QAWMAVAWAVACSCRRAPLGTFGTQREKLGPYFLEAVAYFLDALGRQRRRNVFAQFYADTSDGLEHLLGLVRDLNQLGATVRRVGFPAHEAPRFEPVEIGRECHGFDAHAFGKSTLPGG